MQKLLTRFWFNTENGLGIGVTAYSVNDAIDLIKAESLAMIYEPKFDSYVENIDMRELDQNHVIPNMGICVNRGVWYPNLNY